MTEEVIPVEPVTKARKPRTPSKFVLARIERVPSTESIVSVRQTPVAVGATDRALVKKALELGDGEYEIHYVRKVFSVKTEPQTRVV